jgi:SP family myo-inositol transporter-like MFS transporter 13
MSSAEEPLISRHPSPSGDDPEHDHDSNDAAAYEDSTATPSTPSSPTLFVYLLTFSAGISGLLFGCKAHLLPVAPSPTKSYTTLSILTRTAQMTQA